MEHYKISKLLNHLTVSKFAAKNELRLYLCNYNDAHIFVKRILRVTGTNANNDRRNKKLIFKNNALFRSCISKIYNTFIDNAEDLDVMMPMYILENSDIKKFLELL